MPIERPISLSSKTLLSSQAIDGRPNASSFEKRFEYARSMTHGRPTKCWSYFGKRTFGAGCGVIPPSMT
jgi:hypothetical protein